MGLPNVFYLADERGPTPPAPQNVLFLEMICLVNSKRGGEANPPDQCLYLFPFSTSVNCRKTCFDCRGQKKVLFLVFVQFLWGGEVRR